MAYQSPITKTHAQQVHVVRYCLMIFNSLKNLKLDQFNRENISERRVDAKVTACMGFFTVTNDIIQYLYVSIFANVGKQTQIFDRFSTLVG